MKPLAIDLFYVYEHWRPDKKVCFYVGKGKGKRAFDSLRRGSHHKNLVAKLAQSGLLFEVRFVAIYLTENAAFDMEIERIAYWRGLGVALVNKTNGGDGPSGYIQSDEHRRKKTAAVKAHRQTPEGKALLARMLAAAVVANTGRPLRAETKLKMSRTRKAMPNNQSHIALGDRAKNKSPEHIAAIIAGKAAARARRLAGEQ